MLNILLVCLGGALGSLARYWVGGVVASRVPTFPLGTMVINITGCFVIGVLAAVVTRTEWRDFLMIGFCGGYTTFSSFGYETLKLLNDKEWLFAAANVIGTNVLGFAAVYLGWGAGHLINRGVQ
jgi:CrcB protein